MPQMDILKKEEEKRKLTPSLPQPIQFPCWMMQRGTCKQSIFRSCNIYVLHFDGDPFSFHMPVWKRRQKGLRTSNFALLWVIFKWHHGSEGVKNNPLLKKKKKKAEKRLNKVSKVSKQRQHLKALSPSSPFPGNSASTSMALTGPTPGMPGV